MKLTDSRPVFLNLFQIRQSITAITSILHRISGVLMIILLSGLVYLLDLSLSSAEGFSQVASLLSSPLSRGAAVIVGWAIAHHIFAGLRFMLLDFDLGVSRSVARQTAWLVNIAAVIFAAFIVGLLF